MRGVGTGRRKGGYTFKVMSLALITTVVPKDTIRKVHRRWKEKDHEGRKKEEGGRTKKEEEGRMKKEEGGKRKKEEERRRREEEKRRRRKKEEEGRRRKNEKGRRRKGRKEEGGGKGSTQILILSHLRQLNVTIIPPEGHGDPTRNQNNAH
jgi:hypothetical protein